MSRGKYLYVPLYQKDKLEHLNITTMKPLKRQPKNIFLTTIQVLPNLKKTITTNQNTIKYYNGGTTFKNRYFIKVEIEDPIMCWEQIGWFEITKKEMWNEEENTKMTLKILKIFGYEQRKTRNNHANNNVRKN